MTWNLDIANANEGGRGRLAEFADEIIDVLHAMGMSDGEAMWKILSPRQNGIM